MASSKLVLIMIVSVILEYARNLKNRVTAFVQDRLTLSWERFQAAYETSSGADGILFQ